MKAVPSSCQEELLFKRLTYSSIMSRVALGPVAANQTYHAPARKRAAAQGKPREWESLRAGRETPTLSKLPSNAHAAAEQTSQVAKVSQTNAVAHWESAPVAVISPPVLSRKDVAARASAPQDQSCAVDNHDTIEDDELLGLGEPPAVSPSSCSGAGSPRGHPCAGGEGMGG